MLPSVVHNSLGVSQKSMPDHTRLAILSSTGKPDYLRLDPLKTPALTSFGSSRSTGPGLPPVATSKA